jgi:septal ring factor EnvC (AmiA/AmiB activator)
MTTERWTDERLDRLALTVESSAANINELSQTQVRMMQELADYRRDMAEMRADFRGMVITQTQVLQRIDETQAEVRGLQTENRRILDHLFGEQQN